MAYDGKPFRGFAEAEGFATVAGSLRVALEQVLQTEVSLTCAGRTDAGVHGWGQVVSFDAPLAVDVGRLARSLNQMLRPHIVIRELATAPDDFDARFSASSRTYRYQILNRAVPDPFLHPTTWHIPKDLDIDAMTTAGQYLVGEHDYSSFCRKRMVYIDGQEVVAHLTREVLELSWVEADGDIVEHWITATAFCHQMVRAITGILVEVGLWKRSQTSVLEVLEARDRQTSAPLAPGHGLTLWSVAYP